MDVLSQDLRILYDEFLESQTNPDKRAAFYASVLGIPFQPEGFAVTAQLLQSAACAPPTDYSGGHELKKHRIVAGIDVGSVLNVDICRVVYDDEIECNRREGIFTGEYGTFEEAWDAIVRYSVDIAVVDARPEARKAQELRDKGVQSGICDVWLREFHSGDKVGTADYAMTLDWRRHVVKVDRTQILDATLSDIRRSPPLRTWPEDIWSVKGWDRQMQAAKRTRKKNGQGYTWDSSRAADHFRFSDVYSRIAMDLFEQQGSYIG